MAESAVLVCATEVAGPEAATPGDLITVEIMLDAELTTSAASPEDLIAVGEFVVDVGDPVCT